MKDKIVEIEKIPCKVTSVCEYNVFFYFSKIAVSYRFYILHPTVYSFFGTPMFLGHV